MQRAERGLQRCAALQMQQSSAKSLVRAARMQDCRVKSAAGRAQMQMLSGFAHAATFAGSNLVVS